MSNFNQLKVALNAQFTAMSNHQLFVVDISKDEIWDAYLAAFREGSNPIHKERTEHDCVCCKQFIRAGGKVVAIIDNKMVSIWDIEVEDPVYQEVADAMSALVKSKPIMNIFLHYEANVGTDHNNVLGDDFNVVTWEHFHYKLPSKFVNNRNADTVKANARTNKEVLKRSLEEISMKSAEVVLELIDQNSLYRGTEHKSTVEMFIKLKKDFDTMAGYSILIENYCWMKSLDLADASNIRNTVIGSLLSDLSKGKDLTQAVKSFEAKVAPANYKRPTALITQGMIKKAEETVNELGIEASLHRRYAVLDDITVNNILFVDRTTQEKMGMFDELAKDVKVNTSKFNKVEEVTVDNFVENILPKAESLEMMFENNQSSHLMSLIAPVDKVSPNILKWDNNFTWSYNGEVTDSMKERVKSAGGDVTGVLRFSIQWNEEGSDGRNDLDAHCKLPGGHIYFSAKNHTFSGGQLDVDITNPQGQTMNGIAVENITWPKLSKMPDGEYKFYVNNYSGRNTNGFRAEIEMDGEVHQFRCDRSVKNDVIVAVVNLKNGVFTIVPKLDSNKTSVEHYGINTNTFHKVNMVMNSPNHWDDKHVGNKHWFFILDKCNNDSTTRGFYNEFLNEELTKHRKVFEVLSSKLKTPKSTEQLSGLGFSSTQRNSVLCKVGGSFNRTIKINF